ncbi:MAG: 50S ribosomal protein L35 [Candidatus Kerfeldbacteria bacterium]|nr:50S ribosomal protein L35 [Candidatus Kerfeldbacteria bacterium]
MKLKTHQATAKRFRVTKRGKILKRAAGQDHFNARDSGRITLRKRRDRTVRKVDARALHHLLPYSRIKPSANRDF